MSPHILRLKCTKFIYSAYPDPVAVFEGHTAKGRGAGKRKTEGEEG